MGYNSKERQNIHIHFGGLMSEKNVFLSSYNSSDKECIYTLLIIQFLPFFMPHKSFPHTSSSLASECPIKAVKMSTNLLSSDIFYISRCLSMTSSDVLFFGLRILNNCSSILSALFSVKC